MDKSSSLLIDQSSHNLSMSLNDIDNSLENSMEKATKEEQGLISKNPYLNNNDVPELESINKNTIIFCNKEEYDIKEYIMDLGKN